MISINNLANPLYPNILIIYTGGTFGMVVDFTQNTLVPFEVNLILEQIPELNLLKANINVVSISNPIDSSNANPETWKEIAEIIDINKGKFDGFVIIHGTDTMAYTASALSFMLQGIKKPIILTGSQIAVSNVRSDAKSNLLTSIEIACNPLIHEVCIFFNQKLLRGNRSSKVNTSDFDAFSSYNYPILGEAGIELKYSNQYFLNQNQEYKKFTNLNTDVIIIKLFPGYTEKSFTSQLEIKGLRGIILETYGAGNAPESDWFLEAIEKAIHKGIAIVNISQCKIGSVEVGKYQTSKLLFEKGLINGKDITTEAAITKLMYLLGKYDDTEKIKLEFEKDIVGEITPVS